MELAPKIVAETAFALSATVSATLTTMVQTAKILNLLTSSIVAIYAHLIKALAISFQSRIITDTLAVNVFQVTLVYTVRYPFVQAAVALMENVQHPTPVNASEEEWEQIVKSIVVVEGMVHAKPIKLANVIKDSFLIQPPKNANFLAMAKIAINATGLT